MLVWRLDGRDERPLRPHVMTVGNVLLAYAAMLGMALTVAGLFARGRWRLSTFFPAYVLSILVAETLINRWPERFWTTEFWVIKQAVFDALKLGLVLEIGWRTFHPFPGAEAAQRRGVLVILVIIAGAVLTIPLPEFRYGWATAHLARLSPTLLNGTIWLVGVMLALARWYRVPVHPFYGGVMGSLVAYMVVLGGLLTFMGRYGLDAIRSAFGWIDPPAFFLVCCWWVYLAWQSDGPAMTAHADILAKLKSAANRKREERKALPSARPV